MADSAQLLKELETIKRKLQVLEDKEAIRDILVRYGFTADLERVDDYFKLWTEDGVYELEHGVYKGREQINQGALEGSKLYESIKNKSQHLFPNIMVKIDGDTATAAGYSITTIHWLTGYGEGFALTRCALNLFHFRRVKGHWLIEKRVNIPTGNPKCKSLISPDW